MQALILGGAVAVLPAAATAPSGDELAAVGMREARLVGSARFTFWGVDIYQASLWAEPGFESAAYDQRPFALELRYQRAFRGRDIAGRSIAEMRRQRDFSPEQAQRWRQLMEQAFPDVAPGDRLLGLYLPGTGARFYANGRLTAEIADAGFARVFFGIWLSEQTSAPHLRLVLLGQAPSASR